MGNKQNKGVKPDVSNNPIQTPKSMIILPNNTVQPKVTERLTKTTVQPINITLQSTNAFIISSVKLPPPFLTEEQFFQTWLLGWKKDFLLYKEKLSDGKADLGTWGNTLLNTMGPVGQQIRNTFKFNSLDDKNNLDVLVHKFDQYCVFETTKKPAQQDTYMYIHELQLMAQERNVKNVEASVKNKILKEINEHMFTKAARKVLPVFQFSFDFKNLTLKEIAFIWKLCEQNSAESCYHCGNNHGNKNCPALGKQCLKCKELNHFQQRCPVSFVTNCNYCGGAHFKKQCPAYNEICTHCKKLNHFSWKCQSRILQCHFCGLSHAASRSLCPAINITCTSCKIKGHFASRCKRRR